MGPMLGPHARTDRSRDTRVAEPWLPAPEDGRPGKGQRLTPGTPHNGGRPPPPGTAPHDPHGTQPPQGMQAKGTVLGSHTHTPAPTARGWRTRTARPIGRAVGGRTAPGLRRPSQWWKAPPPGTPFRHPLSEQRRPTDAGSEPRGHLWVTWGVYLCAGKPPLADIIPSHPPDLTRCDSVIGLAIPAMSGHIQYRGAAS